LEISLNIERMAFGGKGVGRLPDGKICFVAGVLPGEKIVAQVTNERPRFAEADLVRVVEPSAERVTPPCPVFGRCGGCSYQHASYPTQLEIKRAQVADTLSRIGGFREAVVHPTIPSPKEYGYRNRITVHVARGRAGFYEQGSRRIVAADHCPIASDEVNRLFSDLLASRPHDGEYPLREPATYRGFRQVNDAASAKLLALVDDLASPGELLVDAYCGAGFFAKRLGPKFRQTIGIEWSSDAIRHARADAREGETYLSGDVALHLRRALDVAPAVGTTVVLDPPAEGAASEVVNALVQALPARIIYVSCDPSTLARDAKMLGASYSLVHATPVDMFPQTAEIETVVLFERADGA
jgi:tRNA/tmRNA/rRNA uracil-C5-methylase (TrmA/RlmC/RlmD family)